MADERFTGTGQLGWIEALGGKGALFPVVVATLAIAALGLMYPTSGYALALGFLVPVWFAWKVRLPHNALHALRHGRSRYGVALDDVGVRTVDPTGKPTMELEWFELDRFHVNDDGVVLVMRIAKGRANAVFVPKSFFSSADWDGILALVRAKLPGSAAAADGAKAARDAQRARALRQLPWRLALIAAAFGGLYLLGRMLD